MIAACDLRDLWGVEMARHIGIGLLRNDHEGVTVVYDRRVQLRDLGQPHFREPPERPSRGHPRWHRRVRGGGGGGCGRKGGCDGGGGSGAPSSSLAIAPGLCGPAKFFVVPSEARVFSPRLGVGSGEQLAHVRSRCESSERIVFVGRGSGAPFSLALVPGLCGIAKYFVVPSEARVFSPRLGVGPEKCFVVLSEARVFSGRLGVGSGEQLAHVRNRGRLALFELGFAQSLAVAVRRAT